MDRTAARLSIDLPFIQIHEKIVPFFGKYMETSVRWAQGKGDIEELFTVTEELSRNNYWDNILVILRRIYPSGQL